MKTLFKLSILAVSGLHLLKPLLPFDIAYALFALTLAAVATGTSLMGKSFRSATVVFLIAGAGTLIASGASFRDWAVSFASMTNIIAIIVIMQLFALPLALGGYQESILRWIRKTFTRQRSLFLFTSVLTHILASFLSFGSVPVAISLLEKTLKKSVDRFERFTATAVSRGYALMALWAPGAVNVFLVLEATGVAWSALLIPGVVLSAIGIGISLLLELRTLGDNPLASRSEDDNWAEQASVAGASRKPAPAAHILVVTASFLALAYVMENVAFGAVYNRIILAGAFVSLVWLALLAVNPRYSRGAALRGTFADHWKTGILKSGDIAPFFIAMGAFSGGLEQSGFLELIRPALSSVAASVGPAAVVAVPVLLVALGLIGIHPFITIVLFGKILEGAGFAVSPLTVALLLAVGGVISYMVSPFTGIIMTIAKLVGAKPSDVGVRWNWVFCLVFSVVGISFAFVWGGLFGAAR